MPEPTKIPRAFAASGDKNSIPDSSGNPGFASWQEGFPAITSEPFAQGGIAPKRADFNGIFNALSLATVWQQQGGFYAYDATTDYEVGNVVEYNGNLYKCITANGPGSVVKAPTDTTVWSKVMTAADAAAAYLPLSGGTMTGDLKFNSEISIISKANNDGNIALYAGNGFNNGAEFVLYGKSHPSTPGEFQLRAKDGSGTLYALRGYPDGKLTWGTRDVAIIKTGTWTPFLKGGTTAGAFTYAAQTGGYVKIGNLVYIYGHVAPSACTTVPTGAVQIGGLPFSPAAITSASSRIMCIWGRGAGLDSNALRKLVGFYAPNGNTVLVARVIIPNSTYTMDAYNEAVWSSSAVNNANIKITASSISNSGITFAGWYMTE